VSRGWPSPGSSRSPHRLRRPVPPAEGATTSARAPRTRPESPPRVRPPTTTGRCLRSLGPLSFLHLRAKSRDCASSRPGMANALSGSGRRRSLPDWTWPATSAERTVAEGWLTRQTLVNRRVRSETVPKRRIRRHPRRSDAHCCRQGCLVRRRRGHGRKRGVIHRSNHRGKHILAIPPRHSERSAKLICGVPRGSGTVGSH